MRATASDRGQNDTLGTSVAKRWDACFRCGMCACDALGGVALSLSHAVLAEVPDVCAVAQGTQCVTM